MRYNIPSGLDRKVQIWTHVWIQINVADASPCTWLLEAAESSASQICSPSTFQGHSSTEQFQERCECGGLLIRRGISFSTLRGRFEEGNSVEGRGIVRPG